MTDHDPPDDGPDGVAPAPMAAADADADAVIAAVNKLDDNVTKLRHDHDRRIDRADKAIRGTYIIGLAIVALLVIVGVVALQGNHTAHRADRLATDIIEARQVARLNGCQLDNELRKSLRDSVRGSAQALVNASTVSQQERTPEETAQLKVQIDAYLAAVDASLAGAAPRDCSPEALAVFYGDTHR